MTSKKSNKNVGKRILIITVVFVLIVLISSVIATLTYNSIAKKNIRENETETIVTFAENMASYSDARFNNALSRLDGYAISFAGAENMSDDELTAILNHCKSDNAFSEIAYVSTNGRTCQSGEMTANPRVYAASALTGQDVVMLAEKIYSVPVKDNTGKINGALVAISNNNDTDIFNSSVFGVSNTSFILDLNGIVVSIPENSSINFSVGENVVDLLSAENDVNMLKTALSQKDVVISENVKYKNEDYIFAAASLKTNNWTLVTVVPYDSVISHSQNVIVVLNRLIFGLTAVFVILAIYLFYFSYKIRKKAEEVVEENNKINYIDDITGYSSWKAFTETYEKLAIDTGTPKAFMALDVDKFKTINDTLGYEGGNMILKQIAEIISRNIGSNDILSRNGSDHFYIITEYKEQNDLVELAQHIISDIDYQITDIKVTVSIGIYIITDHNIPIRGLADRANIARNTIKSLGESSYAFFDPTMIEIIREKKSIEDAMEDALEKGEFIVYLQPKFGLEEDNSTPNNDVIGAEALVRWYHDGQIISPGKFIPIFEKNGFITKLDFYMFREVCRLQKSWQVMGLQPKVISVNMSRMHFPNPDFVKTLKGFCEEFEIDTKYFEIEITESAAFDNVSILSKIFSEIKEAGFHVSIDDFGTGYSSLNMLKDLPVDVLKIDRSFLTENADETENASKIIACVVSLASSLDISTICEGIETKEQANLLSKLGCDMAQGFFFARPMPVKDFEGLVYGIESANE